MNFNFLSSLGFVGQSDEAYAKSVNGYVNSLTSLTTTLYSGVQSVIEYYSTNPAEPMSEQSILESLSREYQSLTGKALNYDTVASIDDQLFTLREFGHGLYQYGLTIHNGTENDVTLVTHQVRENGTLAEKNSDFLMLCDALTDNVAANSVLFEGIKAASVYPNDNAAAVNSFMNSVGSKLTAIDGRSTPYIDFVADALTSSNSGIKLKVVQLIGSYTQPLRHEGDPAVPVTDLWRTNALYEVNTHSPIVAWGLEAGRIIKEGDWSAIGEAIKDTLSVPLKIFEGIGNAVCKVGEWLFNGITKTAKHINDQLDLVVTDNVSGDGTVSGFGLHIVVSETGWTNAATMLLETNDLYRSTGPDVFRSIPYDQIYRFDLCGGVYYYVKKKAELLTEGDLLHCFAFTRPVSFGKVDGSTAYPIVDFFKDVSSANEPELLALISQIPGSTPSSWDWDSDAISFLAAGKAIAYLMAHSFLQKEVTFSGTATALAMALTNAKRTLDIIGGTPNQYGVGATLQVLQNLSSDFDSLLSRDQANGLHYEVTSARINQDNINAAANLLSFLGPIVRKDDPSIYVPYDKTAGVSVGSYHLKSTQETAKTFNKSLIGMVVTTATIVLAIKFGPSAIKGLKKMLRSINVYKASTAYSANKLASAVASGNQLEIDNAYRDYKKVKRVNKLLGATSYGVGSLTARNIDAAVNAIGPEATTTLSTDAIEGLIHNVHKSITG